MTRLSHWFRFTAAFAEACGAFIYLAVREPSFDYCECGQGLIHCRKFGCKSGQRLVDVQHLGRKPGCTSSMSQGLDSVMPPFPESPELTSYEAEPGKSEALRRLVPWCERSGWKPRTNSMSACPTRIPGGEPGTP